MSNSYNYLPIPPRVWSRVQNPCTFTDASGNSDINYNEVYIPLTKQTVTQAQANYEDKLIYKGNILQYKGNSSRLTKSQKYTQLAKGFGPNRTKVFATQSQTYTNPNTTGLRRKNSTTIPFPNPIVGAPNNISGPYQYNVPNPNGCSGVSIQDGGTLVCGTFANPCTGEIIKQRATSATICNPASASDVPGSSVLRWNNKVQTWFPKPRYVMNNSTDKWPVNYKGLDGFSGLVSALTPDAPVLTLDSITCNSVTLSWDVSNNNCIPISSYNIYQNGILIQTQPYITSTTINGLVSYTSYSFYVTSVSNTTESLPSNTVYNIGFVPTNISGIAGDTSCKISWSPPLNIAVIGYNGQVNGGTIITNITSPYVFTGLTNGTTYTFNIYTVATINGVTSSISCPATITLTPKSYYTSSISGTAGTSGGYNYVYFSNPSSAATITFNLSSSYVSSIGIISVGGGGGGGSGSSVNGSHDSGRGGGGAGCGVIQLTPPIINSLYTFNVGSGGLGGSTGNDGTSGGISNLISPSSTTLINCTSGGGGSYGPGFVGSGGQQTVPSAANFGGNGGDTQQNGNNSNTIASPLSVPGSLPIPFSSSYGGGGGGSDQGQNGGSAGSYGNRGIAYAASDNNGQNAASPGGGGGGAGNNNASSGTFYYSGGNGGPGLIGFWWQPLF